jgi:hypothetical protein
MFNANISLYYPEGDPNGWSLFRPTIMRTMKFARLAMLIRIAYHVIPVVQKVPAVAIVIRGCRLLCLIFYHPISVYI